MSTEYYNKWLRQGRCPMCGSKRDSYYLQCSRCRELARERQKRFTLNNPGRLVEIVRNYRHRNKDNNRCINCGKDMTGDNRVLCSDCREKHAIRDKRWYLNNLVRQVRTSILM